MDKKQKRRIVTPIIGLHDYNFLKGSLGEIQDMRYASVWIGMHHFWLAISLREQRYQSSLLSLQLITTVTLHQEFWFKDLKSLPTLREMSHLSQNISQDFGMCELCTKFAMMIQHLSNPSSIIQSANPANDP